MAADETLWVPFGECALRPLALVGGKAHGLGRLVRHGFEVPRGGVLTTPAHALADAARWDELVELCLAGLAAQGIAEAPLAVRSSASAEDGAEHSFAGIHDSVLNVRGREALRAALEACYRSASSERAVAYRRARKIDEAAFRMAVVVMELVPADSAGIAFSCDPRTGRRDLCVVNANLGLGESVVSGQSSPDEWTVRHDELTYPIVARKPGRKQTRTSLRADGGTQTRAVAADAAPSLSDDELRQVVRLTLAVEDALGDGELPYDIEWVFARGHLSVVQARPVTSLPRYAYPELAGSPTLWSCANVKDAVPMVLAMSIRRFIPLMANRLLTYGLRVGRYPFLRGLERMKVLGGRLYLDVTTMQYELWDAFGLPPVETSETMGGHQPDLELPRRSPWVGLRRLIAGLRLFRGIRRVAKDAPRLLGDIRAWNEAMVARIDRAEGKAELLAIQLECQARVLAYGDDEGPMNLASGTSLSMATGLLKPRLGADARSMMNRLMAGLAKLPSAELGYRLVELAEIAARDPSLRASLAEPAELAAGWRERLPPGDFRAGVERYLADFGHRSTFDSDILVPRWAEDPEPVFRQIAALVGGVALRDLRAKQGAIRAGAEAELRRRVPWPWRAGVRKLRDDAVRGAELREQGKSELIRFSLTARRWTLRVGAELVREGRLDRPDDAFHLTIVEMERWLRSESAGQGFRVLVRERRATMERLKAIPQPDLIEEGASRRAIRVEAKARGGKGDFSGIAVSSGRVRAVARVLLSPELGHELRAGEILVAPSTDPGWTPLFLRAGGLLMETGGYLSHGSIVAREFGLPAVANVAGILAKIKTGDLVEIDGDTGSIKILPPERT